MPARTSSDLLGRRPTALSSAPRVPSRRRSLAASLKRSCLRFSGLAFAEGLAGAVGSAGVLGSAAVVGAAAVGAAAVGAALAGATGAWVPVSALAGVSRVAAGAAVSGCVAGGGLASGRRSSSAASSCLSVARRALRVLVLTAFSSGFKGNTLLLFDPRARASALCGPFQPFVALRRSLLPQRRQASVTRRGWPSTHLEQFLMEAPGLEPARAEGLAQGLAEAGRTAEPHARVRPLRHRAADALGVEAAVALGHQHMQLHPRLGGKLAQAGDEAFVRRGGAVEQIDRLVAVLLRQ